MESFRTPYPVRFYDGEQEQHKGFLDIHRHMTFNHFQALVAHLTQLPAILLSVVFVYRNSVKNRGQKRQRLPVHEGTNFAAILKQHNPSKEQDCHFLVWKKISKSKGEGGSASKRNGDSWTSSRGGLSRLYEGRNVKSVDKAFLGKATLPPMIQPASNSEDGQQTRSTASPKGKLQLGEVDSKVEKAPLQREGAGKNLSTSSSSNGGSQVEGRFPAGMPGHLSKQSIMSPNGSTTASTSYAAAVTGGNSGGPPPFRLGDGTFTRGFRIPNPLGAEYPDFRGPSSFGPIKRPVRPHGKARA